MNGVQELVSIDMNCSLPRAFQSVPLCGLLPSPFHSFRKKWKNYLQFMVYVIFIGYFFSGEEGFPVNLIMLLSGDIETNPGPLTANCLKFCHWNSNSIYARGGIKIPLIEAYSSIHNFDILSISETMLNTSISSEEIHIEGFSRDVLRSDHPSNSKIGGICVYLREGLPVKRRTDLEELQELIVIEVMISRKKVFLVALYRTPSQDSVQFEDFVSKIQRMLDKIQTEKPYSVILTGDLIVGLPNGGQVISSNLRVQRWKN